MSAEQARGGAGHAAQNPALHEPKALGNLNIAPAASDTKVNCIRVSYGRCAPIGITDSLVKRAKQEPPGVRLALLQIWRVILSSLNAKIQLLEPLWAEADLDPDVSISPEDRARAEAAAEEALASCKICVVDLQTFLKSVVRRAVKAAKPNGDLLLAVEIEHSGRHTFIVTRLANWIQRTKEGMKFVVPLNFQENLRDLGLEVEANPRDLYLELMRRAESYNTVVDAYLKPILLQAVEKLRASPHLARCSKDGHVIYIVAELFRTALWYFDSHVGLGRNQLYEAFRRNGLLTSPTTIPVDLVDDYGAKVKKRALAFLADRLAEFLEYDVASICRAASWLGGEAEEGGYA